MSEYPHEPGYENQGTSYEAAQKVNAKQLRTLVVSLHKKAPAGLTDAELDVMRPVGCPTLRPRRCELYKQGVIIDTGLRRKSPLSDRNMIVWGLPNAGA